MLTKLTHWFLRHVFTLSHYFGVTKYTWDTKTELFLRNSGPHKLVNFNLCFLFIWICFLAVQILRYSATKQVDAITFLVTIFVALSIAGICMLITIIWGEKMFPYSNFFLVFFNRISGKNINNANYVLHIDLKVNNDDA